jgi:hypothetical protein
MVTKGFRIARGAAPAGLRTAVSRDGPAARKRDLIPFPFCFPSLTSAVLRSRVVGAAASAVSALGSSASATLKADSEYTGGCGGGGRKGMSCQGRSQGYRRGQRSQSTLGEGRGVTAGVSCGTRAAADGEGRRRGGRPQQGCRASWKQVGNGVIGQLRSMRGSCLLQPLVDHHGP